MCVSQATINLAYVAVAVINGSGTSTTNVAAVVFLVYSANYCAFEVVTLH